MLGKEKFPLFILIILAIIVISMSIVAISTFFKLSIASYIPYITWLFALGLLMLILPNNKTASKLDFSEGTKQLVKGL